MPRTRCKTRSWQSGRTSTGSAGTQAPRRSSSESALIPRVTWLDDADGIGAGSNRTTPPTELVDGARLPWEELAQRELSGEILTAINRLSRRQAVAITLRVFEELPYEQIAAAMNCTEATARKHVERARGHLRVVLAKHEPNRSPRS